MPGSQDSKQRFSSTIDYYHRYRPDYPKAVIQVMIDECGLDDSKIIADIGMGTGIFTKNLLDNNNTVFGVEPNLDMRNKDIITPFFSPQKVSIKIFSNIQMIDWENFRGRLLSTTYTPKEGEPKYQEMLNTAYKLFEKYKNQDTNQVNFIYETKLYYGQLSAPRKPKPSFIEFMQKSPLVGVNIDLRRKKDFPRDVDL